MAEHVTVTRPRRIFADVQSDKFDEVFDFAVKHLSCSILASITGMDEGETYAILYHLARVDGIMFNLKLHIGKQNPEINTVTDRFPGADSYEREINDLLGIGILGLAKGNRYPLPDNWPEGEYPLRKEWKGLPGDVIEKEVTGE